MPSHREFTRVVDHSYSPGTVRIFWGGDGYREQLCIDIYEDQLPSLARAVNKYLVEKDAPTTRAS